MTIVAVGIGSLGVQDLAQILVSDVRDVTATSPQTFDFARIHIDAPNGEPSAGKGHSQRQPDVSEAKYGHPGGAQPQVARESL